MINILMQKKPHWNYTFLSFAFQPPQKSLKIVAQKWNCFRILQRQSLWNGNLDAEFVAENPFWRWKNSLWNGAQGPVS